MERTAGKNAESELYRGWVLYKRGYLKSAVEAFDRSIALSPTYSYAFKLRGRAKAELDNTSEALADFNRALTMGDSEAQEWIDRYSSPKNR